MVPGSWDLASQQGTLAPARPAMGPVPNVLAWLRERTGWGQSPGWAAPGLGSVTRGWGQSPPAGWSPGWGQSPPAGRRDPRFSWS